MHRQHLHLSVHLCLLFQCQHEDLLTAILRSIIIRRWHACDRYEVCKKKTKFEEAIKELDQRIARNFYQHGRVQCGIVYCLSRNECEKVAMELQVTHHQHLTMHKLALATRRRRQSAVCSQAFHGH